MFSMPMIPQVISEEKVKEPEMVVVEERSSLLTDSLIESANPQPAPVEFKFEMINEPAQKPEEAFNNSTALPEEKPAEEIQKPLPELSMSQFEEKPLVPEEVKKPEPAIQHPLMKSEPSEEEIAKIMYLDRLASIKDQSVADNMRFIFEMGYINFDVNFNLLKKHGNDLAVVINSLCSESVSDSMFQQWATLTNKISLYQWIELFALFIFAFKIQTNLQ